MAARNKGTKVQSAKKKLSDLAPQYFRSLKKINNKNFRMNQKIGLRSDYSGQTDKVEFGELPFASSKETDLELINLWKRKVNFKEIIYII
ncbi:hypothetical protein IW18_02185 [Flavobacterium hibernum]|uniref:Uncharacterized protein n=2 Tax=Flavobacterium hibernum TaxID=37752 RepID=A0A0D0F3T1_9FLAO|nr:hypothetical protein IW18_02185 [Flavobacterium hibernum]OXA88250.1 hypothetical protein B0A73_10825 [Flavobacterium hibernum]PTS90628.1 hypothetical protein DBR27_21535 [Flavobacterium sp. HMWF030]